MEKEITDKERISQALGELKELEDLLSERISDLHQVKGMMQARHVYCYYRQKVWDIQRKLKK